MKKPAKVVTAATTQEHLDISDIRDDIVLLKSGGAAAIVRTTAVNFGLLSETEQDSIIYAYAGFLNSLSFSIQILILSKKMDITSYLDLIRQQEQKQINPALKSQIQKYQQFVASIIQENKVLDKAFYIIVPFSPLELGVKGGTTAMMSSKKAKNLNYAAGQMLDKAKTALAPRTDNIIRLLTRMGLKAQSLTTTELIKLFYAIYNPQEAIGQKMVSTQDYQTPIVEPVVDMRRPTPAVPSPAQRPSVQRPQVRHTPPAHIAHQAQMHNPAATFAAKARPGQPTISRPAAPQPALKAAAPVTANDVQSVLSRLESEVAKMQKGR